MLQQIETMLDEDFTSESVSVPSSLRCIDNPNAFSAYRCSLLYMDNTSTPESSVACSRISGFLSSNEHRSVHES